MRKKNKNSLQKCSKIEVTFDCAYERISRRRMKIKTFISTNDDINVDDDGADFDTISNGAAWSAT